MKNKKRNIIVILSIVVLFVFLIGPNITIMKKNGWTSSYTGSHKGNTTWIGFITVHEWYKKSPIELWLEKKNKPINHNWVRTIGTSYGLIGGRGSAHAQAPAIYYFLPELQEKFISVSNDEEIDSFLKIMSSGNRSNQEEAIKSISDKMIKTM